MKECGAEVSGLSVILCSYIVTRLLASKIILKINRK